MTLIEIKQVWKTYQLGETRIDALQGVDLTIAPGEFLAVWGPSGSGKSTLCHLIGVLDDPSTGVVAFEGQDVSGLSETARSELRNHRIGFIFQSFNLVPVLSALENVMLPLQIAGETARSARRKALRILDETGLADHLSHRPSRLSGGQRQRVAIARALVSNPALVIADEPTANLDTATASRIVALMRQMNQSHGTAFVFATHDQRLLERATRHVHLQDGAITEDTDINGKPPC